MNSYKLISGADVLGKAVQMVNPYISEVDRVRISTLLREMGIEPSDGLIKAVLQQEKADKALVLADEHRAVCSLVELCSELDLVVVDGVLVDLSPREQREGGGSTSGMDVLRDQTRGEIGDRATDAYHAHLYKIRGGYVGIAARRGSRAEMQDFVMAQKIVLPGAAGGDVEALVVLDGHGGQGGKVASEVLKELAQVMREELKSGDAEEIERVFKESLLNIDLRHQIASGTTLLVMLRYGEEKVSIVNIGDSVCMLRRDSEHVVWTNRQHRVTDSEELSRVQSEGAIVKHGRIGKVTQFGSIGLTRSIGDVSFKSYKMEPKESQLEWGMIGLNAIPDFTHLQARCGDYWIMLSDGASDVLTTKVIMEVVESVENPVQAAIVLRDLAYRNALRICHNGSDNISVVVVRVGEEDLFLREASPLPQFWSLPELHDGGGAGDGERLGGRPPLRRRRKL